MSAFTLCEVRRMLKKGDQVINTKTGQTGYVSLVSKNLVQVHCNDEYLVRGEAETELVKSFEEMKAESSSIAIFRNRAKEMKEKIIPVQD